METNLVEAVRMFALNIHGLKTEALEDYSKGTNNRVHPALRKECARIAKEELKRRGINVP
jgi:hypothetical protein